MGRSQLASETLDELVVRASADPSDGAIASAGLALPSCSLTLAKLRECRLEVASVAHRAHPARRALDPTQLARPQEKELMCLARSPLHANPVLLGLDRAHSSDAAIRHADTITYGEPTGHRPTSTLQSVAIANGVQLQAIK